MSEASPAGGGEVAPTRGIVISHGLLAEGLVDAVRQIAGLDEGALVARSNRGLSPEAFIADIRRLVGDEPAVLFTDLPSGSCSLAARRLSREGLRIMVISGVNLPLLLDFVLHRDLPLPELGPRLVEKGRNAISLATLASE
jgi:mannose/fructose-specific phosphotransferase system component IIA